MAFAVAMQKCTVFRKECVDVERRRVILKQQRTQYEIMTQTPVSNLIVSLSIPTILSVLVTNIYNMADTAFVGQLGNSASGAVGVVFGFMSILQAVGFMFGQGSGSILSRHLGRQDVEQATEIASSGFFGALFSSIVVALICFWRLDDLIMALGSTETIAPYAKTYITYILLAAPFVTTSFTMNNLLRYEGKAALGMIGLLAGALLNIIGDPIFMFVFDMGIAGAGLSTALSQVVGFCLLLWMFLRGKTQSKISWKCISKSSWKWFNLVSSGFPSLLRNGLTSFTTVLLNSLSAAYGDAAVAAMSIVSRIAMFIFSIALGVGQGFQPVSGFNFGAGKYSRVRKAYRYTFFLSEILLAVLSIGVMIASGHLIRLFRDDLTVIELGTRALRLQCMALLFLPFCMVTEMMMQSTGQKLEATILSATRSGLFFIPALWILSKLRGMSGIQEAQPLAYVLSCIPSAYFAVRFFQALPRVDRPDEENG